MVTFVPDVSICQLDEGRLAREVCLTAMRIALRGDDQGAFRTGTFRFVLQTQKPTMSCRHIITCQAQ